MKKISPILLALSLIYFSVSPAFGAETSIFDRILHDFSPVAARVQSVESGTVAVSCGRNSGISAGDLFQVYRKGSPVSSGDNSIIGYLKQPFVLLRAEQVSRTVSKCIPLKPQKTRIRPAMPVMRYSDMKAVLEVAPDMKISKGVEQRLRDTLPALKWVDSESLNVPVNSAEAMEQTGIALVFYLSRDKLTVYGPGYRPIHTYPLSGESGMELAASLQEESQDHGGAQGFAKTEKDRDKNQDIKINFANALPLDSFTESGRLYSAARQVEVVDVDGDHQPETVYLVSRAIYVFPFGREGRLYTWEVDGPGDAVGFSVCGKQGWIVVNVLVNGVGLRSVLLRYSNDALVVVEDEINLWLSFCDRDGDGLRETMLGQSFSLHKVWGDSIYRLSASSEGVEYEEKMNLPEDYRTGWAIWGDVNDNGREDICLFDRSGRGYLYEEGILRWVSPAGLVPVYDRYCTSIQGGTVDLNGDGRRDVVFAGAVPSENSGGAGTSRGRVVYALEWDGERYGLMPVVKPLEAHLAGISHLGNSLLVAVSNIHEDQDVTPETVLYRLELPAGVK